jgi:hypothetical protein
MELIMNIGDKISFKHGKQNREGTIYKIFPKTIYIKADFENHKGRIVIKKIHEINKG